MTRRVKPDVYMDAANRATLGERGRVLWRTKNVDLGMTMVGVMALGADCEVVSPSHALGKVRM